MKRKGLVAWADNESPTSAGIFGFASSALATAWLRKTAVVLLATALTACGFHLRGHYQPPAFLHEITLRTPASSHDFTTEMRLALTRSNIIPEGGEVVLEVLRENLTRQISTVDSSAKAAEYTLIYSVYFRVSDTKDRATGPVQSLILRRSYQYSTTNIVGKSTEEDTLVHELRIDAAQQIVRQLVAMKAPPQPDPAAEKDTPSAMPAANAVPSAEKAPATP